MSVPSYVPNFSTCFSCENPGSSTSRCSCGFNLDIVCEKLMRLCRNREIKDIGSLSSIIESFTLKNIKKISSKFGYKSNITLDVSVIVCAIEFGMRNKWFSFGNLSMFDQSFSYANNLLIDSDVRRVNEDRSVIWNTTIRDSRIFTPPLIGFLKLNIFQSKLRFAKSIQTQLAGIPIPFRLETIRNMLLPDHVSFTLVRRPEAIRTQNIIERQRMENEMRRVETERLHIQEIERQRERLRIENEIQIRRAEMESIIIEQNEQEKQKADNIVKTWKSISIINNVLENLQDTNDETCPICCDDIIYSKKTKTNCGHTVCSDCVSDMITKCGSKCIMCRALITSVQFGSLDEIIKCQNNKIQILST